MNSQNKQKEWAAKFRSDNYKAITQMTTPNDAQKKSLNDEIKLYTKELQKAINKDKSEDAKTILEKLINLKARQTALNLKQLEMENGELTDMAIESEMKKYYEFTNNLIASTEVLI